MEKKIKLSPVQHNTLTLLRTGWEIKQNTVSSGGEYMIYNGRFTSSLNSKTFRALIDQKIIEHKRHGFPFNYFSLTDLGKTIEL